jgi:methylglutamate dehydrogenase subunit D
VFERKSALHGALLLGGRDGEHGNRGVRIGELSGWTLHEFSAFAGTEDELAAALKPLLGELPNRPGLAIRGKQGRSLVVAPGQYLFIGQSADDLSPALQAAVPPHIGTVVSLTHARTCIVVQGSKAREVLAQEVRVDLHPEVLPEEGFVLTGLQHTPALIYYALPHRYEVYVLRTYALSIWELLVDAALPFGFDIGVERIDAPSQPRA